MIKADMGVLYVVATPIGNLQDMTFRAIDVLKAVDRIAAEDTRHSTALLRHFSIHKPSISLHEFNERERFPQLLNYLQQGEVIALISDAGTPLISDPGFHLIKEARLCGVKIIPVPGACAAIAALSVSGLPTDRFTFEGFLPAKTQAREQRLTCLAHEKRTMVFYEAPHRVVSALHAMTAVFGSQRIATVARELTKMYESIMTDTLANLLTHFSSHENTLRGEFVILVQGGDKQERERKEVVPENVLEVLLAELPLKQAVSLTSKITGGRKNELYTMALTKKPKQEDGI